ncbi:hypothetical protein D9758_014236 [Tetrapyrgos nigripes]|uniref:CCHC-type domain-containing protein n=1 Tax=Tetrapyrgos nigripes TaxID=182062 RepID=A0A8H5CXQ5_9AGAR|nr:hypothetical protein D9758_014236 [Tetrapyrgos nigripes]
MSWSAKNQLLGCPTGTLVWVPEVNQELEIRKAHPIIDSETEPDQGTSTPTNTQLNPEPSSLVPPDLSSASDPLPDPSSNNQSNPPHDPSPVIPSIEGPSVALCCPAPTPSPKPSEPDNLAMSDIAPNDSNNTSKQGRKPDAFNRECDEAKQWLAFFNNYLCQNKARYATEDSRVSLFLSFFMGERGGDWATQRITEQEEDEEDVKIKPDERRWTTLKEIRDSYNSIFNTYGEESDFGETALLDYYKGGLLEKLQKSVEMTWLKWKDFNEYRERTFIWNGTNVGPSQGQTVASVNALMNMGPGANLSFTPLPKLTPKERDQLQKLGACFMCRQPGHMSNECPTFPNNTLRPSTSQNTPRNFPPHSVRTAETSAPTPSFSSLSSPVTVAQASSSHNVIKDISDMVNKVKGLEGEEKEQVAVYLNDIMSKLDF